VGCIERVDEDGRSARLQHAHVLHIVRLRSRPRLCLAPLVFSCRGCLALPSLPGSQLAVDPVSEKLVQEKRIQGSVELDSRVAIAALTEVKIHLDDDIACGRQFAFEQGRKFVVGHPTRSWNSIEPT